MQTNDIRHCKRTRPLGAAFIAVCIGLVAHLSRADDADQLLYRKVDTRQATYEATLEAAGLPVFGPWMQVGPFDPILRRRQPPDERPADSEYVLFGGGRAKWREMPDYIDGYANTLSTERFKPSILRQEPTVYLKRTIVAVEPIKIRVYLGCDAGLILWLNGEPLVYAGTLDGLEAGEESVELPLQKGKNTLLMKAALSATPCRFFFMPELGRELSGRLLDLLSHDFPVKREPLDGYRARAAVSSTTAEERSYRLAEVPVPPGVVIEGGGMDFLRDGRLAVSTRRGYVYLVENPGSDDPEQVRFHRFASGLHEALGLKVVDGAIVVVNKGELTRLLDTDGDDVADRFENLCNEWGLSGNYHEYAYGLVQDDEQNFYVPLNVAFPRGGPASPGPYRGWVVRVSPAGRMEPFCYGFRSPNGIGKNAAGDIFVTDNQGEWVPACPLYHIRKGRFYGHPVSHRWSEEALEQNLVPDADDRLDILRTPPAVWFPYDELSQSATDVVCDPTDGRFGPFAGQLFVGEMTKGLIMRVQLERVNGRYQGSCFLFRRGCGAVNRMTFGPDGRLYLSRANRGWGGGGLGDGMARIEYTGRVPLEIHSVHLLGPGGFELTFTQPLAEGSGDDMADYDLEQYTYHNWATYGSPRIEIERIEVRRIEVSSDRRTVRLGTSNLKPGKVCRIELGDIVDTAGLRIVHSKAYYTLNEFPTDAP